MIRIAADVVRNVAMGVPAIRAWRLRRARTSDGGPEAAAAHALAVIDRVVGHAGPVAHRSVLEIGPGDDLATGLGFLALGARAYTALDRFPGDHRGAPARATYRALRTGWAGAWPEGLDPNAWLDAPQLRVIARAVEDAGDIGHFDVVCSHAVGEHVRDVAAFAHLTAHALAPGGIAVHIVDFSGHHWHDDADPLRFHRIPGWLWHAMGSNRGLPNRVPFDRFSDQLCATGMVVDVLEIHHCGDTVIEATFVCRSPVLLNP